MVVFGILLLFAVIDGVSGHGRLIEPPSRASMWRFGYKTPTNYDDNQMFCGGFSHQWELNQGKCGVCGDPWDRPRENEAGGKYATGTIVRYYNQGQTINVTIDITANHRGYFEFRLCPNNNPKKSVSQKCLDRYLLRQPDGRTRYHVTTSRTGLYTVKLQLPAHVTCSQCMIQWKYNAGNSYGCVDGNSGNCCVGCGPQEQFYGCADVSIITSSRPGRQDIPKPQPFNPQFTSKMDQTEPKPSGNNFASHPGLINPPFESKTLQNEQNVLQNQVKKESSSLFYKYYYNSTPNNSCQARGLWTGNVDMTSWCVINCKRGNCPSTMCSPECAKNINI